MLFKLYGRLGEIKNIFNNVYNEEFPVASFVMPALRYCVSVEWKVVLHEPFYVIVGHELLPRDGVRRGW